jgi:uncharacterized membrane protein YgcG
MTKSFYQLILLLFIFWYTKESSIPYDSRNFYCNGRIYSDNNGLSINEINSICSKITADDRYVILFTNQDRFIDEKSYTYASEDFFSTHCYSNTINCKYDFAICIFLWGGKVIITSGSIAKNVVTQGNRMNIINNMVIYLKNQEYYTAIQSAITEISKLYYQNGGRRGTTTTNKEHSTFVVFFFIIIILCCCVCCYFIYQNQQKSNEELTYTKIVENGNGDDGYTVNQNYTYDQSLKIHNHLVALEKMIEEINQNDPPIKNTNMCLICMQSIINTVGTLETGNTRFACQHVYHKDCLSRYNIHCCLMCKDIDQNASIVINNYHDSQVVNEEQVKNFIKNLQLIYPPQELKIYSQRYPQEYNNFNDGLMLGLLASNWGMPPVVVVNNNPGYYEGYNNYNQQNMYGGDPNPDSAVGGFQSNNIEMQEINNANNENNENTGGNFGGNRNNSNNSNNSGSFGGEGNNDNDAGSFSGGGGDYSADGGDF